MPAGRPKNPQAKVPDKAPKSLNERHKTIAMHAAQGMKQTELCKMFGMAPSTMSVLFNTPLFQALVEDYRQEQIPKAAKKMLREASTKAAAKLIELTDSDNDFVSLNASNGILNRTMTSAAEDQKAEIEAMKIRESKESLVRHIIIDASTLRNLKALDLPDDVIDVPYDVVPSIPALLKRMDEEDEDA